MEPRGIKGADDAGGGAHGADHDSHLYQRFRDKKDILELLRRRAQAIMFSYIRRAHSAEEFCQRYFEFASRHRNEYELIHADWVVRLAKEEPRPSFELLKKHLADRLGGTVEQHASLALALAALLHGTATMLLTKERRGASHASCGTRAWRRLKHWLTADGEGRSANQRHAARP